MEQYFDAKKRLFTELLPESGVAVINGDDAWGKRLLPEMADRRTITYGIDSDADIRATGISSSFSGSSFVLEIRDGTRLTINSPFIGRANVYNVLAAAAAAVALDISGESIVQGVAAVRAVEGRMEKVEAGQRFLCIVDYAHTPDALERLILTAREIGAENRTQQRPKVITVFGCGGNRDRGKRPVMGEIASRLSDRVFITSDNPRNEDPLEIIKEIKSGIINDNYFVVPDRREAIAAAIENASDSDIVLLAGKGHEEYQETGGRRERFSDGEVAKEAILKRLGKKRDPGFTNDHAERRT
jgi:UDP-N-acetylmuramoyl-L-alanyl-D-glutamate--2,6-diaminopimelate ligase